LGRAASLRNSLMRTSGAQAVACSRRAIRSITRSAFHAVAGGSATIPLAMRASRAMKYEINMNADGIREAQYFVLDNANNGFK
jgi:hypothetical protein